MSGDADGCSIFAPSATTVYIVNQKNLERRGGGGKKLDGGRYGEKRERIFGLVLRVKTTKDKKQRKYISLF